MSEMCMGGVADSSKMHFNMLMPGMNHQGALMAGRVYHATAVLPTANHENGVPDDRWEGDCPVPKKLCLIDTLAVYSVLAGRVSFMQ